MSDFRRVEPKSVVARIWIDADWRVWKEFLAWDGRWVRDEREGREFNDREEAATAAVEHRYVDVRGEWHTPFALVKAADPVLCGERQKRVEQKLIETVESVRATSRVTPEKAYAALEKRGLA